MQLSCKTAVFGIQPPLEETIVSAASQHTIGQGITHDAVVRHSGSLSSYLDDVLCTILRSVSCTLPADVMVLYCVLSGAVCRVVCCVL